MDTVWRLPPSDLLQYLQTRTGLARFIRTVCMRRIRWSCEGLTSVHNEYTGYSLKHLLLRHMYNLSLSNLCATLLNAPLSLESTCGITLALRCAVPYMAACVVISGTVFWDHSSPNILPPSLVCYSTCNLLKRDLTDLTRWASTNRVFHKLSPIQECNTILPTMF